jgi:hypothetical protein
LWNVGPNLSFHQVTLYLYVFKPNEGENMTSKDIVPVTAIDEEFNKDVTIPGRYEIEGIIVNLR